MQNSRRLAHPKKDVSTCSCQMAVDIGFGENILEEASNVLDKRAAQTSELRTGKGWTKIQW